MKQSILLFASAAFFIAAPAKPLSAVEPLTKEAIRQAWLARETQAERMKLSWDEEVVHPKGSISAGIPDLQGGPPLPAADTTHTHRRDLLVDGRRIRISGKTTLWNVDTAKFETAFQDYAFDGKQTQFLIREDDRPTRRPRIQAGHELEGLSINLEPIWLATRPGNSNYLSRYRLDNATLSKEPVSVDGASYVELKWDSPSLGIKRRLLLDPKTLMAHRAEEGSKKTIIDYHAEGPLAGWPNGWGLTSDDAYARKHHSRVRSLEFPRVFPADAFELKLDR